MVLFLDLAAVFEPYALASDAVLSDLPLTLVYLVANPNSIYLSMVLSVGLSDRHLFGGQQRSESHGSMPSVEHCMLGWHLAQKFANE